MAWNNTEPAATSKIRSAPAVFLGNWEALEDLIAREHRAFSEVACGGHRPGECAVLMIDGTAEITALNDVPSALAYDVDLHLFKYNNGAGWISIGGSIQTGTKMLFYADAAPTGWTLDTTVNDKLAYIVAGSENDGLAGGIPTEDGTWVTTGLSGDPHDLTVNELPVHNHTYLRTSGTVWKEYGIFGQCLMGYSTQYSNYTGSPAGDAEHTHEMSAAGLWRPSSFSFIICTKD